jgi:hypothetical protein
MRLVFLLSICVLPGAFAVAQETRPGPGETPAKADPSDKPLSLDLDTVTSAVLARMLAIPRFEEEVEVRDRYQEALDAHLRAAELECGATSSGPPRDDEMNRFSANPKPPSADFVAAGKLLFSRKKPRFFLYSVRREAVPERVVYVVRDGPVSEDARSSIPGTAWALVEKFADRGKAADALSRLERGFVTTDETPDTPRTLWAATGCGR